MNRTTRVFIVVGTALWLIVTGVVLVEVVETPGEHGDLALGLLAIWVLLLVLALGSRVTERL